MLSRGWSGEWKVGRSRGHRAQGTGHSKQPATELSERAAPSSDAKQLPLSAPQPPRPHSQPCCATAVSTDHAPVTHCLHLPAHDDVQLSPRRRLCDRCDDC